jgi:hypothetical protein
LVFLPEPVDEGFASRTPFVEDDPSRDPKVLYAHDAGGRNIDLVARQRDREPFRLDPETSLSGDDNPVLRELEVRAAPALVHTTAVRNVTGARCVSAYALRSGSAPRRVVLDRHSAKGRTYRLTWTVHARGSAVYPGAELTVGRARRGAIYAIGVALGSSCRLQDSELYETRYTFRTIDRDTPVLEVLAPGQAWQLRRRGTGRVWLQRRTDPTLRVDPS